MSSRLQVRKIRNATMGVADSHNRKAKISVTTAKVRRDRTPKLKPQSRAAANTKKQSDKANRRKPVEPSTRFGNCKEAPITLDDDEDEMDGGFPGRTLPQVRRDLRRDMTTPPPAPSSSSIYSPQFGKTTPSRSHTPYGSSFGHRETFLAPPVTARLERRERDQSFYASASPSPTSPSTGSRAARSVRTSRLLPPAQKATPSHHPVRQEEEVVTLGDISDFETRKNVVDLMAVAPGLHVRDLYGLLIDMRGDLPAATKRAIRASRAPSARPSVKTERTPVAPRNFVDLVDLDGDDVMIKIDPNAAFLEWDSDAPPPEPITRTKSSRSHKSNVGRKRGTGVRVRHRRHRENSIDEFVVGDGHVQYDTDKSSSVGSDERSSNDTSDEEMLEDEDPEDLRINMRRKYAYNAKVLNKKKRSGGGLFTVPR